PPEQLRIGQRPSPTRSKSQRYGSGFHGSPVVTMTRSDERSVSGSPCCMSARIKVGEQPRMLTPSASIVRQRRGGGGRAEKRGGGRGGCSAPRFRSCARGGGRGSRAHPRRRRASTPWPRRRPRST